MTAHSETETSSPDLPSLADLWEITLDAPEPEEYTALSMLETGLAGGWTLRTMKVTPGNRRLVCVFETVR